MTTKQLQDCLSQSDLLKSILAAHLPASRTRLFADQVRELSQTEIIALENRGNRCRDWQQILVAENFQPSCIFGNTFAGSCVLGYFSGAPVFLSCGAKLENGIYHSTIIDSEIGDNCLVKNTNLISGYLVYPEAVVFNTQSLTFRSPGSFGNGTIINLGDESGSRPLPLLADLTLPLVESMLSGEGDALASVTEHLKGIQSRWGIVQSKAMIENSGEIKNSFVGYGARIENACLVENTTLLSREAEPAQIAHGAIVRDSCLQPGARIHTQAIIERSVMLEHSCAANHAKVSSSIIGPNTQVEQGEVTSSLLGPFIGFHHQSLVISCLWPQGKGNVGYGANVGSNHTSRAPDQELFCGEGIFFGLGTNIKFPADFRKAPYTIFATGVTTQPQRLDFPFSLVRQPSLTHPGLPPYLNEIIPGWVISDNPYLLVRCEEKFKTRNKAQRHSISCFIFNRELMELVRAAQTQLQTLAAPQNTLAYTGQDLHGLGKNFLTTKNKEKAIRAYSFFSEYTELRLYYHLLKEHNLKTDRQLSSFVARSENKENLSSLIQDHVTGGLEKNLNRYLDLQLQLAEAVETSKAKDDSLGQALLGSDYSGHPTAAQDSIVRLSWDKVELLKQDIKAFLGSK